VSGRAFLRFVAAALAGAAAAAGVVAWRRAALDRRFLATGPARWIWYAHDLPKPAPLAFTAWKDFRLAEAPPRPLHALLFVDREGTLELNGAVVGRVSRKPGDPFARFDATPYLRAGENRVRITAAHPTGAGGLLFALELPDGTQLGTDGTWRLEKAPGTGKGEPPRAAVVWGKPPLYPWGYPAVPTP